MEINAPLTGLVSLNKVLIQYNTSPWTRTKRWPATPSHPQPCLLCHPFSDREKHSRHHLQPHHLQIRPKRQRALTARAPSKSLPRELADGTQSLIKCVSTATGPEDESCARKEPTSRRLSLNRLPKSQQFTHMEPTTSIGADKNSVLNETRPEHMVLSVSPHPLGWSITYSPRVNGDEPTSKNTPRVPITISIDKPNNRSHNQGSNNKAKTPAIADTGAQSDLCSLEEFITCGFSRDDLQPVSLSLSAANRSPIAIEGAFFARLTAASRDGAETTCRSMVYVSSSV